MRGAYLCVLDSNMYTERVLLGVSQNSRKPQPYTLN